MNNLMMFISNNMDTWREKLSADPYNLIIKEDADYPNVYLFKYNQFESDMNEIICQEARGIILEIGEDVKLLCHSFDKFFNHGEEQGKEVLKKFNWKKYTWQEKRDGSLMRLWNYKGEWKVSTSGTIDAYKAEMQIPSCPYSSFGDMFENILTKSMRDNGEDFSILNPLYTYSFEMTSPNNKIVVNYTEDELTLIGVRDISTNTELSPYGNNPFKGISCANFYIFEDLDSAIEEINCVGNFEGLVVCDDSYRRVKIKTDEYLMLARMVDDTNSDRGILKLILEEKIDDVVSSLPHLQRRVDLIRDYIKHEIKNIEGLFAVVDFTKDRKDIALQIQGNRYSGFVFKKISNPDYDFKSDYFKIENLEKIYKGYKEDLAEECGEDGTL